MGRVAQLLLVQTSYPGFYPAPSTLCQDPGAGKPVPLNHTTSLGEAPPPDPPPACSEQRVCPLRIGWWPQSSLPAWLCITTPQLLLTGRPPEPPPSCSPSSRPPSALLPSLVITLVSREWGSAGSAWSRTCAESYPMGPTDWTPVPRWAPRAAGPDHTHWGG